MPEVQGRAEKKGPCKESPDVHENFQEKKGVEIYNSKVSQGKKKKGETSPSQRHAGARKTKKSPGSKNHLEGSTENWKGTKKSNCQEKSRENSKERKPPEDRTDRNHKKNNGTNKSGKTVEPEGREMAVQPGEV